MTGKEVESASNLTVTELHIYAPQINACSKSSATLNEWVFNEGCMVSGTPAVTADAEGKMQVKSFTLVFEQMSKHPESGWSSSSSSQSASGKLTTGVSKTLK